jgi:hypothetical protein
LVGYRPGWIAIVATHITAAAAINTIRMSAFDPKRTLVEWQAVGGAVSQMIVSVAQWPLPSQQLALYLPIVFFSKVHTDIERQFSP